MTYNVEATYENGVLKLSSPLPLREHEKVRLQVEPTADAAVRRVKESAGIVKCADPALIDWAATSSELDHPERD